MSEIKNKAVIQSIIDRRSIKKYKQQQISDEQLDAVLEAGTYAPSFYGRQSALIVVTQNPDDVSKLSKLSALAAGLSFDPFYGAPTVVTVFADKNAPCGVQDASLVMGNMLNAAHAAGLGSCWVNRAKEVFESDDGKELMKKWGLEDKWVGVAHCLLGYADHEPVAAARKDGYILKIK